METKNVLRSFAIDAAGQILLDGQFWYDVKMFVKAANWEDDPTLTKKENNDKRHAEVKDKLLIVFGDIGETLLDWAIKFGVLWLKSLRE